MRGAALNCWLAVNGIQNADMSEGVLMSLIGFMVTSSLRCLATVGQCLLN